MAKKKSNKKKSPKKAGKSREIDRKKENAEPTKEKNIIIKTDNLIKEYGKSRALNGLNMNVPENSIYGLVGPNGAGKTTTLGILATFIHPTSGTAEINGHDVVKEPEKVKNDIGILPQDALLYQYRTAVDIITFYANLSNVKDAIAEANSILDRVGMGEHKHKKIKEMSHGMIKLVGIAQALVGKPKIILLDEATAGLDPRVAFNIRNLVRELKKEATVIFSSHNLYEIEDLCDHVGIVHNGKIILEGKTKDIIKRRRSLENVFMERISREKK